MSLLKTTLFLSFQIALKRLERTTFHNFFAFFLMGKLSGLTSSLLSRKGRPHPFQVGKLGLPKGPKLKGNESRGGLCSPQHFDSESIYLLTENPFFLADPLSVSFPTKPPK